MLLFVSDGRAAAHVKVGVIGAKDLHSLQEGGFLILQIRFFPGVQLGDLGLYVLQLLFQPADFLCGSARILVREDDPFKLQG